MTVRSMTGFGAASGEAAGRRFHVEARSVNHRFLDVKLRLGRELAALESDLQKVVAARLSRGRVDISLNIGSTSALREVQVDEELAARLVESMDALVTKFHLSSGVTGDGLMRFPDLLTVRTPALDVEEATPEITALVESAINELVQMRAQEGGRLALDLAQRVTTLRELEARLRALAPGQVVAHRQRLESKLAELLGAQSRIGDARLAQEVALIAERTDVTEELTRLNSHLDAFADELQRLSGSGKRLEFVTQELLREVNTIGSKVSDAEMTALVIDAKCELEKVREQVANLE